MDLELALKTVDNAFDEFRNSAGNMKFFNQYNVIQALNVCLDHCIESGDNYPAYYDDMNSDIEIYDTLCYISDRWFASGRIRFILRVIGE